MKHYLLVWEVTNHSGITYRYNKYTFASDWQFELLEKLKLSLKYSGSTPVLLNVIEMPNEPSK